MTLLPLRLRRYRPSDMPAIEAIEQASFGRQAWPRELLEEYAAISPALFLVAAAGEELAAYSITVLRRDRAELVSIAVLPRYRRAGAGRTMLQSILRRLKLRGVRRLHLAVKVTNRPALRFYESFGFRKLRRVPGYYEDGRDAFLMAREV